MNLILYNKRLTQMAVVIGVLAIMSVPVKAQQFREVAAGWDDVASAPASTGDKYSPGAYFRGSIGSELASRVQVRFDGDVMLFRLKTPLTLPCPSAGCPGNLYDAQTREIAGLTANVLVGLDPRQIVYVLAGVGPYETFAAENSLHIAGSVGAGIAIPVGSHYRVFAEATWRGFAPEGSGPSWAAPFAVGLRF